jgi:uncharacterized integral membrane protein
MSRLYTVVSGTIFAIIAVLQVARALMQVPVHVGTFEVPFLASWLAALVTGALCVWAFRSRV